MKIIRLKLASAILFGLFPACAQAAQDLPPQTNPDSPLVATPLLMPCAGEIVRLDCPQRAHCRVANCLCENDHTAQFAPCIASRREQSNPDNFPRARHSDGVAATSDEANPPPETDNAPPPDDAPLHLKRNRSLTQTLPADEPPVPIFIRAMRLQGHKDAEVEAFDDVELRQLGQVMFSDHIIYRQPEDEVFAEGKVRIEQKSDATEGVELRMKLGKKQGYLNAASFQFDEQIPHGRGTADKMLFEGDNRYRLEQTQYTTCPVGEDDWFLRASALDLDRTTQVGVAHHASIEFMGVPILYTPWLSFPLDKARKSGFLAPSFGSTGRSGSEFTLPYYWNIAPNRDATIATRLMQKRGVQLNGELRYLDETYTGKAAAEFLPSDQLLGMDRYFLSLNHVQTLAPGLSGALNVQKASDNDYFRDMGTQLATTSQITLPREGALSYNLGAWGVSARAQTFQTLQDPSAPVVAPYHRLPQVLLNGGSRETLGTDMALAGEYVNFTHPTLINGQRLTFYPSVSLPLAESYGYLTPKLGWHATRYTLDQTNDGLTDATRSLPVFSVDGGLHFERDAGLFGQSYQQTLEPRLYYLNVPYRDQSQIPNFDSGQADFNYARLFTENRFSGGDRFNDANHLTLAVTSRLLEAESGRERIRATLGQRYYFEDQLVTLPDTPVVTGKTSDILALLSGNVSSQWSLDSGWQYSQSENLTEKFNVGARYQPAIGKTLNMGYRYTRDALKQVDVSSQWPLTGRWNGLGRLNYSLPDSKMLEGLAGVEYNAGCWAFRTVVHSFTTAATQRNNALFFQLELNGIGQIGSNPFDVLRSNIYGYAKPTETTYDNQPLR
ncbi:MAG: LPS-assembly protein LptD [Sulfuricellaceae bacterium]